MLAKIERIELESEGVQLSQQRVDEKPRQRFAFMGREAVTHQLQVGCEFLRSVVSGTQAKHDTARKPPVWFVRTIPDMKFQTPLIVVELGFQRSRHRH